MASSKDNDTGLLFTMVAGLLNLRGRDVDFNPVAICYLVIDLKGDMVDLLLNFPSFAAEDFAPWLPPDALEEGDRMEVATKQAEFWRKGLEGSGLGPDDLLAVRDGVKWQLLTPGAGSAAPLDILPALGAPEGWDPDGDPDAATDRVNGVTSALLSSNTGARAGRSISRVCWRASSTRRWTRSVRCRSRASTPVTSG